MSDKPRVIVVDGLDRFVRWEDRRVVHRERIVHRTVHIALFRARGELWIQKRHRDKLTHASHWDLSTCGHVEEPDFPDVTRPDEGVEAVCLAVAHRELREELGVDAELVLVGRFGPVPGVHYEQIRLYTGKGDGPFTLQDDEVEAVQPVTPRGLEALIASGEKVTETLVYFANILRERGLFQSV